MTKYKIYLCTSKDEKKISNAAFLVCCYIVKYIYINL